MIISLGQCAGELGPHAGQANGYNMARPPAFAVLVFRGTEQRVKDFIADLHVGFDTLVQETVAVHKGL